MKWVKCYLVLLNLEEMQHLVEEQRGSAEDSTGLKVSTAVKSVFFILNRSGYFLEMGFKKQKQMLSFFRYFQPSYVVWLSAM